MLWFSKYKQQFSVVCNENINSKRLEYAEVLVNLLKYCDLKKQTSENLAKNKTYIFCIASGIIINIFVCTFCAATTQL